MQSDKTCPILEQYLAYLLTIKGRSQNTILEYRMDLLQFFRYIADQRKITEIEFKFADADFMDTCFQSDPTWGVSWCCVASSGQTAMANKEKINGIWTVDLGAVIGMENLDRVTMRMAVFWI